MEKLILDCAKCGGALTITEDMELFKCDYCATPYLVKREQGAIHLVRLEEKVKVIEKQVDRMGNAIGAMNELTKLEKTAEAEEKEEINIIDVLKLVFVGVPIAIAVGALGWSVMSGGGEWGMYLLCFAALVIIAAIASPWMLRDAAKKRQAREKYKKELEAQIRQAHQK